MNIANDWKDYKILEKANSIDKDNEYIISNIENYIASVKAERSNFKELEGEFVNGKNIRKKYHNNGK